MTNQTIQDDKVVSLTYVLTVDGEEASRADANEPLEYLHGAENIVPGLEAALTGKKVGDKFSVTIQPDDAYGEYDEDDIDEFPRNEIPGSENLEIGMMVEIEDEDGYVDVGMIKEITPEAIIVDFNAPLAGKTLHFDVQVVAIREADEEELDHGHPHSLAGFYGEDDDDIDEYEDYEDEE
ncbi:MAG: peptidylprolyl isomerase [Anaerolineaceae bacterium]|nr:peptidylprolyl isomerase [Anaerolineaceae bacterium]